MFIIHFMISEKESMLRVIIVYGGHSSTNRMLVSVSILISLWVVAILLLGGFVIMYERYFCIMTHQ